MSIAKITRAYVRHYRDNGQTTAYVEWVDHKGNTGRTEGSGNELGAHMRALFTRAECEGISIEHQEMVTMGQDQIEALEFMLDDYGVEGLLNAVADALGRKVSWLRCAPLATEHGSAVKRYMLQADALRAQASALAAGRALTYATQAPLGK